MSRMRMGHVAGVSLALLLGSVATVEAQVEKRRPGVGPVTGRQPAAGQPGAAVTAQVSANILLPCCVLEGVEQDLPKKGVSTVGLRGSGGVLVVRHKSTGKVERLRVSSASAAKFRPGQAVAMKLDRSAIAITPFPVKDSKKSNITKSSWKMETDVTVSKNGRIDGKTKTKSSEAARGFTGGVEVLLTDRAGNILHQTKLRTYGVNGTAMGGQSSRTENWNETVAPDALNKVSAVVIHHSYEPKVRLAAGLGWIKDNWKLVHKVYKCGRELLAEDEDKSVASAPPPPPPPSQPTSQSQPPASDTSALECLEATQELAEELGY